MRSFPIVIATLCVVLAAPVQAQMIAAAVDDAGRVYVADWSPDAGAFVNARQVSVVRGSGTRRGIVMADFDEDGDLDLL
ncbi:MAG: VCBS repeat-containing protein, partial [Myxococcales bacterium]|nr:VCBS repeat-containing protein [Myxococcales bacterium]